MSNSCTAREILLHDSLRLFGLDAQGSASWSPGIQVFINLVPCATKQLLLLALRNSLANKKTATAKRLATGHQPSSNTHYTVRHRQATS